MLSPTEIKRGKKCSELFSSSSRRFQELSNSLGFVLVYLLASNRKFEAVVGDKRTNRLSFFSTSRITKRSLREIEDIATCTTDSAQ